MKYDDNCAGCIYKVHLNHTPDECRRFPPQATGRSAGRSDQCTFQFPPAHQRCGEYKVALPETEK